jgi:hypothetical protein
MEDELNFWNVEPFSIQETYHLGEAVSYEGRTYVANQTVEEEYPDRSSAWTRVMTDVDINNLYAVIGYNPLQPDLMMRESYYTTTTGPNTDSSTNNRIAALEKDIQELKLEIKKIADILLRGQSLKETEHRRISSR